MQMRYRSAAEGEGQPGDWVVATPVTTATDHADFLVYGLSASTRYDVQASLDGSFPADATQSGVFTTNPNLSPGFDLHENNGFANGVWSDGTTIWVADRVRHSLLAYNLATEARDSAKDIAVERDADLLTRGIWSDGSTIWVTGSGDPNRKLFAYNLTTGARLADKDIDLDAENGSPFGVWSDGTTVWVMDVTDRKTYAYNLTTKARQADRDIDVSANLGHPSGIWSDGVTMWASSSGYDVREEGYRTALYAYDLATKVRDPNRDIDMDGGNGTPAGIWSDGTTMYVADIIRKELFAYVLPPVPLLIEGIEGGDNIVNIAEQADGIAIYGKAPPGATVAVGVGGRHVGSAAANADTAVWRVTVPSGASYVTEDTMTVTAREERDGQQFTATRDFAVDLTPPTVTILSSPVNPYGKTSDNTPEVVLSANEAGLLSADNPCGRVSVTVEPDVETTLTYPQLSDGAYQGCAVTFTDMAGNQAAIDVHHSHWDIVVDTQPPTLTVASDAGGGDVLLWFSEELVWNIVPRPGAFTVQLDGVAGPAVVEVILGGQFHDYDYRQLTLELAASLPAQGTVTLDYDHRASEDPSYSIGPLRDEAGNLFLSVTDYPVSRGQEDYDKLGPGKP